MRVMGVDLGTKRIGIAISDESATLAQGREAIERTSDKEALARIKEIAGEYGVSKIVLGYPVNMDGTVGPRAEDSEKFAELIKEVLDVEVELWDERWSTKEAEDVMITADLSRKKRKKVIDKMAAQIILQGYLDSISSG